MTYRTKGTCSQAINYEIIDGKVRNVSFQGGCDGNLKAICKLIDGVTPEDVIAQLEGIKCGFRSTSCGDQLAQALKNTL